MNISTIQNLNVSIRDIHVFFDTFPNNINGVG
jgi:hypothetical protein